MSLICLLLKSSNFKLLIQTQFHDPTFWQRTQHLKSYIPLWIIFPIDSDQYKQFFRTQTAVRQFKQLKVFPSELLNIEQQTEPILHIASKPNHQLLCFKRVRVLSQAILQGLGLTSWVTNEIDRSELHQGVRQRRRDQETRDLKNPADCAFEWHVKVLTKFGHGQLTVRRDGSKYQR